MKKILAVVKKCEKVLGYVIQDGNYREFDEKTKLSTENAKVIELPNASIEIDDNRPVRTIFKDLPVGTPLKIKGICEGMNGQQLVYVGNYVDELGTTWHMFFDGKCASDDFPEAFGYATQQLEYDDVKVIFNKNNIKTVESLQNDFSFLYAVAEYTK